MPTHWSTNQLDMLRNDWLDPKNSLSQIAAHINAETQSEFSRSAIAGKAKRLDLPLRRRPNGDGGRRPRAVQRKPSTRTLAANFAKRSKFTFAYVQKSLMNEPVHLGLTLFQINETTCKYPRGDESKTFCGQASHPDSPYCSFHHQLCYRPPESRPTGTFRRAA